MNPVLKIISSIINTLNVLLESMDRRTEEAIKQVFFFLAFVAIVVALVAGYISGKKGARRHGTQVAEHTNQIFDTEIKRNREEGGTPMMLDRNSIREMDSTDINKLMFPTKESPGPEVKDFVVEPKLSRSSVPGTHSFDMRDKVAEIDRTDDKRTKGDVRELKRREAEKKHEAFPNLIVDDKEKNVEKKSEDIRTVKPKQKTPEGKTGLKKEKQRIAPREKNPGPLDKDSGVVDK